MEGGQKSDIIRVRRLQKKDKTKAEGKGELGVKNGTNGKIDEFFNKAKRKSKERI